MKDCVAVPVPVYIDRLIVEEGFLDGLDLEFGCGLNVLVGPRGVGKTTVIQLIRFALGAAAFNERYERAALSHARSVLGGEGRVSVRLRVDGEEIVVSRRARDELPEGDVSPAAVPIVLAQTEIEEIGVDPEGRLLLIDDFRAQRGRLVDRERAALSRVESMTLELAELDRNLEAQRQRMGKLSDERAALSSAPDEVAAAEESTTQARDNFEELDRLGTEIADHQVRLAVVERTKASLTTWAGEVASVRRAVPVVERWPGPTSIDPLEAARGQVIRLQETLDDSITGLAGVLAQLEEGAQSQRGQLREREDRARDLRRRAEAFQQGAGAVARRLAALRERVAELNSLEQLLLEQERRREDLHTLRERALAELDSVREERFLERRAIASSLNVALGPRIAIDVKRSGLWGDYADAIGRTIQGSGLHYKDFAPQLAGSLSPPELVAAVEAQDAERIAAYADIPEDRARRVVDRFREAGVTSVLTSRVEDAVDLRLLDGDHFKSSDKLSVGQRCTTVLPVVLLHEERPVTIDQPEDHLDGAFIVETLVKAVLARPSESQLIISTHNANIPVLGNAARVTLLGSDGSRGFERYSGSLDDRKVVDAITSIMEGGREAFARRAAFYDVGRE